MDQVDPQSSPCRSESTRGLGLLRWGNSRVRRIIETINPLRPSTLSGVSIGLPPLEKLSAKPSYLPTPTLACSQSRQPLSHRNDRGNQGSSIRSLKLYSCVLRSSMTPASTWWSPRSSLGEVSVASWLKVSCHFTYIRLAQVVVQIVGRRSFRPATTRSNRSLRPC